MPIILDDTEMQALRDLEIQAADRTIEYWQIYEWLIATLDSHGVSQTDQTMLWLKGAAEANADRGAMSELIRGYTAHQYQLRYDEEMDPDLLQEATDEIAAAVNDRSYQCAA